MVGGVGQQRHVARALDFARQPGLILGHEPGLPARLDLASIGEQLLQLVHILVVDEFDFLGSEDGGAASARGPAAGALEHLGNALAAGGGWPRRDALRLGLGDRRWSGYGAGRGDGRRFDARGGDRLGDRRGGGQRLG